MKRFRFLGEYYAPVVERRIMLAERAAFALLIGLIVLIVGVQIGIHHGRSLEKKAQAAEWGSR